MENKTHLPIVAKHIRLLPANFKRIGMVIMLLSFISMIIIKTGNITIIQDQKELLSMMTVNVFILGLLFFAWARDKMEDERTFTLRLNAIGLASTTAVCYMMLDPLFDRFLKDPITDVKAQDLVLTMLFIYLFAYFIQKKAL